jgi:hypothetical protein
MKQQIAAELFRARRVRRAGKSYMTAVAREAYATDRLVAWTGHRTAPSKVWRQAALDTPTEFYARVEREL